MTEWDRETWPDDYGKTQGRTKGLELDDGTYLECYETELVNQFGEAETFEVIGLDRYTEWYGWGPHDMTVRLSKGTIQSMFDSGDLTIVDPEDQHE